MIFIQIMPLGFKTVQFKKEEDNTYFLTILKLNIKAGVYRNESKTVLESEEELDFVQILSECISGKCFGSHISKDSVQVDEVAQVRPDVVRHVLGVQRSFVLKACGRNP